MEDVSKWPVERRKKKLEEAYLERMGTPLNLDNPQKFSEKVQWRKLYDTDDRRKECVDKLRFKQYLRERIDESLFSQLIDVWHCPEDVNVKIIPRQCVIKSNCASEGRYAVIVTDKDDIDIESIEKDIKSKWFDKRLLNTNSFNNAYYGVEPCVLIEKYLFDPKEMDEFKMYCFDGQVRYLYRYSNHFSDGENMYGKYPVGFYDSDWNYQDVRLGKFGQEPPRPEPWCFEEMKNIAHVLSSEFSFVRVDFFVTPDNYYVAEMCFNPLTGLEPYYPESFDYELGSLWEYPVIKNKCIDHKDDIE